MDLELTDRVVIITGGTDGVGLALAERLLQEGAHVTVCGRDQARLESAATRLGPGALVVRADVTLASEAEDLVAATRERFGRVNGLVNNAGRALAVPVASASDEEWREDLELKVVAAQRLVRLCWEDLCSTSGSVVNVLAISARTPGAGSTPTAASRAAGLALTKALSREGAPHGVRANAVLIGLIESGQWERRASAAGVDLEEYYRARAREDGVPLGRFGRPEEFADLVSFLLSGRASYLTGVGVSLDGGLSPSI